MSTLAAAPERPSYARFLPLALPVVGLAWAFWPTLADLAATWNHNPQYSHGFLVPLFAGFLLWSRRDKLDASALRPSMWGLAVLALALAVRLVGAYQHFVSLDALALVPAGIDPAAEEALGDPPLEQGLLLEHLQGNGLGRVAEAARAKARLVFRDNPQDPEAWYKAWRRAAQHLTQLKSDPEELKEAQDAFVRDQSEENLRHLLAIMERMKREAIDAATG